MPTVQEAQAEPCGGLKRDGAWQLLMRSDRLQGLDEAAHGCNRGVGLGHGDVLAKTRRLCTEHTMLAKASADGGGGGGDWWWRLVVATMAAIPQANACNRQDGF